MPHARASEEILLSVDRSHIQLEPGNSSNITLTIENNGSIIDDYNITVDASGLDAVWEILPAQDNVTYVVPTTSKSVTVVIRLSSNASAENSSSFFLNVEETDTGDSSSIEVFVSVLPTYLPYLSHQTGTSSLKNVTSGTTQTYTLDVSNLGSVNDSILLDVGQEPDLSGWWANMSTNSTGNGSGNGSGTASAPPSTSGRAYNSPPNQIPAGWSLLFDNDTFPNMVSQEVRQVNLTVTIPSDATPEFYGFRLFSGSLSGNITTSTLIVIQVISTPSIAVDFLRQNDDFFPGETITTSLQITNTGNSDLNMTWATDVLSGPCTSALPDILYNGLAPSDVVNISLNVSVSEIAQSDDSCELEFEGTENGGSYVLPPTLFTIDIDEHIDFELVGPTQLISLTPGTPAQFDIRVYNNGTDSIALYLDYSDEDGLSNTVISSTATTNQLRQITVDANDIGIWEVEVDADLSIAGSVSQGFQITYGSVTDTIDVVIDVATVPQFEFSTPEDRFTVRPDSSAQYDLSIENTGTQSLALTGTISGVPSGVTASYSSGAQINMLPTEELNFNIEFIATASASPGTHLLSLTFSENDVSSSISIALIIEHRYAVEVSALQSSASPSPLFMTNISVEVVNYGTITDTYTIDIDTSELSAYYTTSLSTSSLTVPPASTGTLVVGIREANNGAPSTSQTLSIHVQSTTDSASFDTYDVTIEPLAVSSEMIVTKNTDAVNPGGLLSGTIVVTNTGSSSDSMYLTTTGIECGLGQSLELGPGASSSPIEWNCEVPETAPAGSNGLTFRVTSAARNSVVMDQSTTYTVLPAWSNDKAIDISTDSIRTTMPFEGGSSMVIRLTNEANAEAVGSIEIFGEGAGNFDAEWTRLSDSTSTNEFTLEQGASVEFKLTLTSLITNSATSTLHLRTTSEISNIVVQDELENIRIEVLGPDLPPNGLSLPLGLEVTQSQAVGMTSAGWLFALLFFLLLRRKSSSILVARDFDEVDDDEVKDTDNLGFNECRIGEDNKVRCPSCEAKLGVPRNSTPPFKFTCPKCSSVIRVVGPPSQKF